MRALAVVQVRMTSRRLPGKTLADVCGEPLLGLLLRRLSPARSLAGVCVATSTQTADDPIVAVAQAHGARVHRGPLDDVLSRLVGAVGDWQGPVVRLTGDCPLSDPGLVDDVVSLYCETPGCRYAANVDPRVVPDGLDVEVVDALALREIAAETRTPEEREHVTEAVRRAPERFPAVSLRGDERLGALRWTVDTPEDLAFVRAVVARLGAARHTASWREILALTRALDLCGWTESSTSR